MPETLEKSASMSSCIPLTTKKNGMKTPKATAVSLESNPGTSCFLSTWRVIRPAAKPPSSRSRPELVRRAAASANTSTTIQRTASWELFSSVRSNSGSVRCDDRTAISDDADRERHEGEQDRGVVDRAAGREDQRDEQDRAELAHGTGAQQVGAEAGLQLSAVGQDRDQGADRGRGHRRSGVEQRQHDPGRREEPADRVGERERDRPAEARPDAADGRRSA